MYTTPTILFTAAFSESVCTPRCTNYNSPLIRVPSFTRSGIGFKCRRKGLPVLYSFIASILFDLSNDTAHTVVECRLGATTSLHTHRNLLVYSFSLGFSNPKCNFWTGHKTIRLVFYVIDGYHNYIHLDWMFETYKGRDPQKTSGK